MTDSTYGEERGGTWLYGVEMGGGIREILFVLEYE